MSDPRRITDEELAAENERLRAALRHRDVWAGSECRCDEDNCPLDAAHIPPPPRPSEPSNAAVAAYIRAMQWGSVDRHIAERMLRRLAAEGIRYEGDRP